MVGDESVLIRWAGLMRIGWRRVTYRLTTERSRQTLISVLGIAIPVALLLIVGSIGLGLTADPGNNADVDYWIVPEGSDAAVADVDDVRLGDTRATADRLAERSDIEYVTPMLIESVVVDTGEERVYLLAIGIVPHGEYPELGPLTTDSVTQNDVSTEQGGWIVLSESASEALDVGEDESLTVADSKNSLTVVSVEPPGAPGLSQFPIGVVHLEELQSLTGADDGDRANQLLIVAPDATGATLDVLESTYPGTEVRTRGGLLDARLMDDRLPTAMAIAALLITVITGTLFVSTTLGFELAAESRTRGVMAAIGLSPGNRMLVTGVEVAVVCLYGAFIGVLLWLLAVALTNGFAILTIGTPIAVLEPRFPAYGAIVALGIGAIALPYVLLLERSISREGTLKEM